VCRLNSRVGQPSTQHSSQHVGRSARSLIIGLVFIPAVVATLGIRWGSLSGLDDLHVAERLLESRGILCMPSSVRRVEETSLETVCSAGRYRLTQQMSCDERLACQLGFDSACWDLEVISAGGR
jgi:hypothetical protein